MSSVPHHHETHDYAERIRVAFRNSAKGSAMYALWLKCGVSRDTISHTQKEKKPKSNSTTQNQPIHP